MAKSHAHRHNFNRRVPPKRRLQPVPDPPPSFAGRPFGVPLKTLGLFYESMAQMVQSGTSIDVALTTFAEHSDLAKPTQDILQRIRDGASFAESMGHHLSFFPERDIVQIQHAESTGNLDVAFHGLVKQTTFQIEFRSELMKTLRPVMFNSAFALVLLPIGQLFSGKLSALAYGMPIALCLVFFASLLYLSQMTQPFRWLGKAVAESIAAGLAKLPGLRSVFIAHMRYRLSESMYQTLSSGVSLALGIPLTLRTIAIPAWRQMMTERLHAVLQGGSISQSFAASGLFDQRDLVRITSGETAGKLDEAFAAIAADANAAFMLRLRVVGRAFSALLGLVVTVWIVYSVISGFTERLNEINLF